MAEVLLAPTLQSVGPIQEIGRVYECLLFQKLEVYPDQSTSNFGVLLDLHNSGKSRKFRSVESSGQFK
jgi:hypothetical protein